jgi:hypothetical protein
MPKSTVATPGDTTLTADTEAVPSGVRFESSDGDWTAAAATAVASAPLTDST